MPRGRTSWYGGPRDSQDNDRPALPGASNKNPGIAVYNRRTLGGWWRVVFPNGRSLVLQQTDLGPAPWTGKKVDVNYTAVKAAGYTEGSYPTGAQVEYHFLGRQRPAWADQGRPGGTPARVKPQAQPAQTGPVIGQRQALLVSYLQNRGRPGALASLGKGLRESAAAATPAAPPAAPAQRPAPKKGAGGLTTGKGSWGGGAAIATPAVLLARQMGIPVTSRKRNRPDLGAGRASDHDVHNKNAYAVDLAASGSRGDKLAKSIARRYGIPLSNIGTYNRHTITVDGKRYSLQLLWRVDGHYDHVHLGIRRA